MWWAKVGAKREALQRLTPPADRKALRRFLSITEFYRRFCKNYAQVSLPLTDLVSPKRRYLWTKACQVAFETLKHLLTSSPVLKVPDLDNPFVIQDDACDVGAVLLELKKVYYTQFASTV
ncbi:uncharacterized mitochondrial protein AtMg00860-like [Homarus americanus]|uniref:uncharacterized mitochondrial protein AtMg00860-like n=1 Tax=Homarus americanus TaxID=6706 RepID=UPI001C46394D|nr:uncharacterized mitochondrial protein AtMg00860-like [Homarus americanus]